MAAYRWKLNTMLAAVTVLVQALSAQQASTDSDSFESDDDIIRQEMAKDSAAPAAVQEAPAVQAETPAKETAAPVKEAAAPTKKTETAKKNDAVLTLETDVVVGYGTSKKSSLTGAVTTVDSKAFTKTSPISVDKALQGKAAGVFATQNSGAPGKEMSVRIRGVGSVNSSNPLYIVDGVPTTSISHLSPQDIESISILKDAPSAAIYGSRAANGVVLVTTKKGKAGDRVITYDAQFGFQNAWKKPDMVNSQEWAKLRNDAEQRGKSDLTDFSGEDLTKSTDWWAEVENKNAPMQSHSVSISGGDQKASYFLSGNFANQEGIIRGSEYSKLGMRSNLNASVQKWLSLGYNLGINGKKTSKTNEADEWNSVVMTAQSMDPITTPRDENGKLHASEYVQSLNPVGKVENTHNHINNKNLIGNVFSDISIREKVKNHTSFGIEYDNERQKKFIPSYFIGGEDQVATNSIKDGFVERFNWSFENTISYDNTFGDAHAVKVLAGFTAAQDKEDSTAVTGYGTTSNDSLKWYQDAVTSTSYEVNGSSKTSALVSGFGRASYELFNKYFISASVRADGSSKFGPDNKWGVFPSVSGAWRISEEGFMQGADVISNLKLRGGWGMLGNQDIGDFLYLTTVGKSSTSDDNYPFGGAVQEGNIPTSTGTPDIHWENQTSVNAGFDLGLLDDKIELNADLFDKKTTDMLVAPTIPSQAGYDTPPTVNKGEIDNKGIEGVLSFKQTWGDFNFEFGSNISAYRNEVLSLGAEGAVIVDGGAFNKGMITRTEVGHSVGEFYGLVTDGLFQDQAAIDNYVTIHGDKIQPDAQPGDIKYKADPETGDFIEDFIGSPHPKFVYGFNLNGTYKAFDLSVIFQGSQGNKIFNATRFNTDNNAAMFGLSKRMLDSWNGAGSTNDVSLAAMNTATANSNMLISDRYIEDGSYLRIKNLQLGYTVPPAVSNKLHISKFRVFTGVDNLVTFTKYSGLDPEIGEAEGAGSGETKDDQVTSPNLSIGVDRGTYPQSRTFTFGINCTL